jgi:hypothetical protein
VICLWFRIWFCQFTIVFWQKKKKGGRGVRVVLVFELMTLYLLSKCSTTWTTSPHHWLFDYKVWWVTCGLYFISFLKHSLSLSLFFFFI